MRKLIIIVATVVLLGIGILFAYAQTSGPIGDAMPATGYLNFVYSASFQLFYDGTNYRRWLGAAAGADGVSNSTASPWTSNFLYGYNGTTWDRLYTITTQADAQAASLNGLITSSFMYGYNGTTFDMLRVGASNELQTTDIATRPGEDAANDWRKVKVEGIATLIPAAEDTAAFSALTTILASTEIISYTSVCLWILNSAGGAAASLSDALVQVSPDNSNFVTLSWDSCDALAANAICVYCIEGGQAYRYVRLRAQTAGATTTTRTWLTANKG